MLHNIDTIYFKPDLVRISQPKLILVRTFFWFTEVASRRFTVDSAKKKEFINIFLLMPKSSVLNAMKQAKFTEEDIADLQMWRFLQRALPGGSIKGLKAYIAGLLPRPPNRRQRKPPTTAASPEDKVADRHQHKPPPHLPVDPAAATAAPCKEVTFIEDSGETVLSSLSPGTAATKRKVKRKRWDHNFYINKKNKRMVGLSSPAVTTTTIMTTTTTSTTTSMTKAASPDMDPWAVSSTGKVHTPAARKMAKHWRVQPAVDNNLNAGNVQLQAALLRALTDHPQEARG
jgi:hypothetical protein